MTVSAVCAGILAFATSAVAGPRTLPTPPPSEFVDAESSVNVPLDPSRGPLMRLRLAADFTPSNAVTVAFGTDADNDGDLAPGETEGRVGVDCGVPFVGKESKSKVEVEQWNLSTYSAGQPTNPVEESKSKVEVEQWNLSTYSAGQPEQEGNILCSTSTSDFDYSSTSTSCFTLKQPKAVCWNLAKVTTHNFTATNLVVRLSRIGTTIFVR